MVKKVIFIIAFLIISLYTNTIFTQLDNSIQLSDCYNWAMEKHPINNKKAILDLQTQLKLEQIDISKLPKLELNASASFQSEAVQFPFEIPGTEVPTLPLFRTQATVDGSYLLYDGGVSQARKGIEQSVLNTSQQSITVAKYPIHNQINQAFFGILLAKAQIRILEQIDTNLQNRIKTLQVARDNGVALQISIDQLEVRRLEVIQQTEQLKGKIGEAFSILNTLTGQSLSVNNQLEYPQNDGFQFDQNIQRPELELFQLQKIQITSQESLIEASRKPKVNLFLQAGLGYPHPLNFFDDSLNPFAIGGVGFKWNITDWKKSSVDRQMLSVQSQLVDNQKEVFLDQIENLKSPYQNRYQTLQELINQGNNIVNLQQGILQTYATQLDEGIITSTDYIEQLNKTTQAQLNLELYRLQIEQLKVEYKTLLGN